MFDRLDNLKSVQAAALLLRQQPHQRMGYYLLLKQLYLADRMSLDETGFPILGGQIVAMEGGPLHSVVYDWLKPEEARRYLTDHERKGSDLWKRFIVTEAPANGRRSSANARRSCASVRLKADPGDGELSDYEVSKLQEVSGIGLKRALDLVHSFPEWNESWESRPEGAKSTPIGWGETLAAVGRGDQIADLAASEAAVNAFREAVGV